MIGLRPMTEADLPLVAGWLGEPHVARWWGHATVEAEIEKLRRRVVLGEAQPVRMLIVLERTVAATTPIGWCQWYSGDSFPEETEALGAEPGDRGLDYAIGEPSATRRGLGTELIAGLVTEVRRHNPGAGIVVDPDAGNRGSRRVLERNGFTLLAVRPVATEPTDDPMAIYRLPRDVAARHSRLR